MKKSSFLELVLFSWNKILNNFKTFFDIAIIPFFIVLLLTLLTSYHDEFVLRLFEKKGFGAFVRGSPQTRLVDFFLITPLLGIFLVNWHRYIIFNGKKPWKLIKFDLSKYTWIFIWAGIKISLTILIPYYLLVFFTFMLFSKVLIIILPLIYIGVGAVIFFYTRLLLILPAAAAENNIDIKRIFNLSKGNFWKIFLIYFLSLVLTFLIIFISAFIFEYLFPTNNNVISWFLINFITQFLIFIYLAFNAGCLSKIYIELNNK